MNKNIFIPSVASLFVLIFFIISNIIPVWFVAALSVLTFIIVHLSFELFSEKREEQAEDAKQNQKKILEKAFRKGQSGAFKGYGFNKENKSWIIKNK